MSKLVENLKILNHKLKTVGPMAEVFNINNLGGISFNPLGNMNCDTSACYLGEAPFCEGLEPIPSDYIYGNQFRYTTYTDRVFPSTFIQWSFLFDIDNPNLLSAAIERGDYIIENGEDAELENFEYSDGVKKEIELLKEKES